MKRRIQKNKITLKAHPMLLLAVAALLHISVAGAVLAIGRFQLMPTQFAANGIGNFASDGFFYQDEATHLAAVIQSGNLADWATWPTQFHVRLYSLPLAALSRWFGFSVLTIEPLNLFYYLAILTLVFGIGKEIFDYRAGLLTATIVAVWPSFLLHTTQLVRDPLIIVAVLILCLAIVRGLKREYAWHEALLMGALAALAIVVIRIVRLPMWTLTCAIVWSYLLFLLVRLPSERRILIGNLGLAAIMIAAILLTPHFQSSFRNQQDAKGRRTVLPEQVDKLSLSRQIAVRRDAFGMKAEDADGTRARSEIDMGVHFRGVADIIRYLPRALAIGFFAPFPSMWLNSTTEVGGSGRFLSDVETLFTYLIEALALMGLWRARRQLAAWFLFLVIGMGIAALGLIVSNIGALYRLRYAFWILIVILGAGGAVHLLGSYASAGTRRRKSLEAE